MADEGAKTSIIRIAFHPSRDQVRVEALTYEGAHFRLLRLLGLQYVEDQENQLLPENYKRALGHDIAKRLKISADALRKGVSKFRMQVRADFKTKLGRDLYKNDVIENVRTWEGYRLNPWVVRVVSWDQLVGGGV